MKRRLKCYIKNSVCCLVLVVLFASCTTGNKFASSFSKRKYNKGYYVDVPGKAPKVNTTRVPQHDNVTSDVTSTTTSLSLAEKSLSVKAAPVMQYRVIKPSEQAKPTNSIVPAEPAKVIEAIKGDGGGRHVDSSSGSPNNACGLLGFVFIVLSYLLAFLEVLLLLSIISGADISAIFLIFLGLATLIIFVVGFIMCIVSVAKNDNQKNWAIAGLLSVLLLILFFAALNNGLFR